MDTSPLRKTLEDGRQLSVGPSITVFGALYFTAKDADGRQVASGELREAVQQGAPADRMPFGCTHWLGGMEPIWFTPDEASRLAALGAAVLTAFAGSEEGRNLDSWRHEQRSLAATEAAETAVLHTPDGMALAAERDRLRAKARAVLDADDAQREEAYESGDPGHYYRQQKPQNDAAHDAVKAELNEFDEQHPEIAAALNAAGAAAARRFLEHD
ncbi:hypothetical protein [Kitasatospora purpeofusca]|uniref:hypothetical protein n=1 Tax=Kitasatospora purpeofusca TaxID=67352 RepID=UPI003819E36E